MLFSTKCTVLVLMLVSVLCAAAQTPPHLDHPAGEGHEIDPLCGPKSLRAMGELVGLDLGIDDVAARMDITERGVSMLDIFSASQELGIPLSPTRLGGLPDLAEVDQYAIAHVNGDHSFAIEKIFDTTARVINHEIGKPEFYSWG